MNYARALRRRKSLNALRSQIQKRFHRHRTVEALAQGFPLHKLHHEEDFSIFLDNIVNGGHTRVAQPAGILRLFLKTAAVQSIVTESGRQALESNRAFELEVKGTVNLTHATPAYPRFDQKSTDDTSAEKLDCSSIVRNPGGRFGHNLDTTRLVAFQR